MMVIRGRRALICVEGGGVKMKNTVSCL